MQNEGEGVLEGEGEGVSPRIVTPCFSGARPVHRCVHVHIHSPTSGSHWTRINTERTHRRTTERSPSRKMSPLHDPLQPAPAVASLKAPPEANPVASIQAPVVPSFSPPRNVSLSQHPSKPSFSASGLPFDTFLTVSILRNIFPFTLFHNRSFANFDTSSNSNGQCQAKIKNFFRSNVE